MPTLLVAVANDARSRLMFSWVLENVVSTNDKLHILHVSVRDTADEALPGSDYFEQAHPAAARQVVQEMLHTQYLAPLKAAFPDLQPVLHVVQASQDSKTVGRIICEKAQQLQAEQVYIGGSGSHRSKLAAMLAGSVVAYVQQHCKVPVTVVVQEEAGLTPEQLIGC